jgi:hypothetical protein
MQKFFLPLSAALLAVLSGAANPSRPPHPDEKATRLETRQRRFRQFCQANPGSFPCRFDVNYQFDLYQMPVNPDPCPMPTSTRVGHLNQMVPKFVPSLLRGDNVKVWMNGKQVVDGGPTLKQTQDCIINADGSIYCPIGVEGSFPKGPGLALTIPPQDILFTSKDGKCPSGFIALQTQAMFGMTISMCAHSSLTIRDVVCRHGIANDAVAFLNGKPVTDMAKVTIGDACRIGGKGTTLPFALGHLNDNGLAIVPQGMFK